MRLASLDGATNLTATIADYEFPDDLNDLNTANWLEVDLTVQTPHGWGTCRTGCMLTWHAIAFADWLEALGVDRVKTPALMAFPEPNLQLKVTDQSSQHIRLHVTFVLEHPGRWEMDDEMDSTPVQESKRYYVGEMDFTVRRAALRTAAESWRADLRRFPVRVPKL